MGVNLVSLRLEREHASLAHIKLKGWRGLHYVQHGSCGCVAEGLVGACQDVHGTWTLPASPPISWNHIPNPPLQEIPRLGKPRSIEGFGWRTTNDMSAHVANSSEDGRWWGSFKWLRGLVRLQNMEVCEEGVKRRRWRWREIQRMLVHLTATKHWEHQERKSHTMVRHELRDWCFGVRFIQLWSGMGLRYVDTAHSIYISMAVGSGWELSHRPAWVGREGHVDVYKDMGPRVAMWLCCVVCW